MSSSDAHKATQVGSTFTWIKANPTFEGLRQIIFEPERIKIQEQNPNTKEPYNVIKSVRFIDESDRFTNEKIYLNPDLNTIIGGKSTGKSLLLHYIAKTLIFDKKIIDEKGLEKNYNKKNNKGKEQSFEDFFDFDFEVEFADGKKIRLKDKEKYIDKEGNEREMPNTTLIEFIPQQSLSKIVEGHNRNDKESPYQKLVEKSLSEKNGYDEVNKKHEENCKNLEHQIQNTLTKLFETQESIENLKNERYEMGNQQDFKESITQIEEEITALKDDSSLSEEEKQNFEKLQKDKNETLREIDKNQNQLEALRSYQSKITVDWNKFINSIDVGYNTVINDFNLLENNFLPLKAKIVEDLKSTFQQSIDSITNQEESLKNKIEELNKNKLQIESELQPFETKTANYAKIQECEKETQEFEVKIRKITSHEAAIENKRQELQRLKERINTDYQNLFQDYNNYVDILNSNYSIIFEANGDDNKDLIELHSELGFEYDSFESNFLSLFNRQSSQINKDILTDEHFFDEQNQIEKDRYVEYSKKVFDLLLSENVESLDFIKNKTPRMAIESLFENRFKVDYKLKYENDSLENMSQGKKGIVLLKLYLAIEKAHYPILIDQPEDNLDNRTIYTSLMDFIKKRKIARQIIMVTHNANLVVSTDAEQIIVANQTILNEIDEVTNDKKFKFEYVTGALEHTKKKEEHPKGILYEQGIREHVCEILEGGDTAFKKREEKYGLKK